MNGSKKRPSTQKTNQSNNKAKLNASKSQTTEHEHVNSPNEEEEEIEISFEVFTDSYEMKEIAGKNRRSWAWDHFYKYEIIGIKDGGRLKDKSKIGQHYVVWTTGVG